MVTVMVLRRKKARNEEERENKMDAREIDRDERHGMKKGIKMMVRRVVNGCGNRDGDEGEEGEERRGKRE